MQLKIDDDLPEACSEISWRLWGGDLPVWVPPGYHSNGKTDCDDNGINDCSA